MKLSKITLSTFAALSILVTPFASAYATSSSDLGDTPYTLYYSAAGAENTPSPATTTGSQDFAIITITDITPSRDGYIFAGWSITDDNTPDYYSGDIISLYSQDATVYATWTPASESTNISDAAVIDSDDSGYISADDTATPLGRTSSSQDDTAHMYSLGSCIAIALGAIFVTAILSFGAYNLADLHQTIKK